LHILTVTTNRPEEVTKPLRGYETNVSVVEVNKAGSLLKRNSDTAQQTWRALADCEPDVVLLDCFETMGVLVTLLSLLQGVPTVPRLVGNKWRVLGEESEYKAKQSADYTRLVRLRLSRALNNITFRYASGFIVVSQALADVVTRRTNCPPEKIHVVHVPATADPQKTGVPARARDHYSIDADRVILTTTNLTFRAKYQGIVDVLDAVVDTLAAHPDTVFVVAGDGEFAPDLQRTVDSTVTDSSIRDRIHLLGFVDNIDDLYALADVFLYVSYLDGYPNVVLEAQTARLPVVTNDAHGMSEQVIHDETGLFVDPSDVEDVAKQLTHLLRHPDERDRLGRNARSRVYAEDTPEVIGQQLVKALTDIVNDDPY
jgi:glycosyltransferase involved in cell wall biosynthesis